MFQVARELWTSSDYSNHLYMATRKTSEKLYWKIEWQIVRIENQNRLFTKHHEKKAVCYRRKTNSSPKMVVWPYSIVDLDGWSHIIVRHVRKINDFPDRQHHMTVSSRVTNWEMYGLWEIIIRHSWAVYHSSWSGNCVLMSVHLLLIVGQRVI